MLPLKAGSALSDRRAAGRSRRTDGRFGILRGYGCRLNSDLAIPVVVVIVEGIVGEIVDHAGDVAGAFSDHRRIYRVAERAAIVGWRVLRDTAPPGIPLAAVRP